MNDTICIYLINTKVTKCILFRIDTDGIMPASTKDNGYKFIKWTLAMNTWAKRIKLRMKELNLTQEMLAGKMGITRGAITHYLAGRRAPPLRQFQKLAAILKTDPAWLQYGTAETSKHAVKKSSTKNEPSKQTQRPIPLLSWEQVTELVDTTNINQDDIEEHVPHFFTDQPRWFALRVKGDAMTAPISHSKSFHEGDILIVDPDKSATHGSYVIAILPRAKEATFKQYVIDGGTRYLKPLNSQYPIVQIDDSTHICGVVANDIAVL